MGCLGKSIPFTVPSTVAYVFHPSEPRAVPEQVLPLLAAQGGKVERTEVAGFTVLDTPGHSPGHVSYWREADRTLICGDVYFNMNILTLRPGLREPPSILTADVARNRESARRLGELRPALVLFGHGPPLRDPERFARFAQSL